MNDLSVRATMPESERWMFRKVSAGDRVPRDFPTSFEVRVAKDASRATVLGYASTTGPDNAYTMRDYLGEYREEISPGAFGKTLSESPKVQLLENHAGRSMAYTRAGSLILSEDSLGLHFEAEVNMARGDVRDMVLAMEDGAYDECSFAFRVLKQSWSADYDYRKITEVSLDRGDVSVVNFGANPNTGAVVSRAAEITDALREGRAVSAEDVSLVSQALGYFAAIDTIVDQAQEQLAASLGVPNPDDDESEIGEPVGEQLAATPMSLWRLRAAALDLH